MAPVTPRHLADAIRVLAIDAIERATEGHQGVPLGMAEIATALYTRHLRFNPQDPLWPDRDRVVLSNGHGSMLLYALLHLTGYQKIDLEQVKSFRELGSHCAGHPEYDPAAGIEVTTGPLGQGIANAVGMAVAEAHLRARFGEGVVNHRTYAFVGDGCLQEGIGQEAIQLAGHLGLGKLTFFWDDNQITDDGSTELSISENVADRFRVAGWQVIEVDGHDVEAVSAAITLAHRDPRPSMIACKTVIAKGIPRLQGQRGGHSARLFPEDLAATRQALGWPHGGFDIPSDILAGWRAAGEHGAQDYVGWHTRLAALPAAQAAAFRDGQDGRLPECWQDVLADYASEMAANPQPLSTIQCSGEVISRLCTVAPDLLVTCADLEAPTNHKRQLAAFTATNPAGRYVHCGVREHLMGAMVNGMAAHRGVNPLSVTYLAFSDYQRPAMRMAALMGLPAKFVFSHDSIGVGKNGPTHQPVEILAALRVMPNMLVFRPADAVEVAECWEVALEQTRTPSTMVFAKQPVPPVRGEGGVENRARRGAYLLEPAEGGPRQVTLLATGSEVHLAVAARQQLQAAGIATAVVSMPCWELFDQQDAAYRDEVLGTTGVRIGVEAALRFGWDAYLGRQGGFVGMTGFGASGPADQLYQHFGITVEAIVQQAHSLLASSSCCKEPA